MTPAYIRQPMTGHERFIAPVSYNRPPVLSDTRARPARQISTEGQN